MPTCQGQASRRSAIRSGAAVLSIAIVTLPLSGQGMADAISGGLPAATTSSQAAAAAPSQVAPGVAAPDDPWAGLSVGDELKGAAYIYRTAALTSPALGDWRTRERVDYKAAVMVAYWMDNQQAGPAELYGIGQAFDRDWQRAVTSAEAAGIRDRYKFANLLVDLAGYVPAGKPVVKYGQALLKGAKAVLGAYADPAADNALRDQVTADANAAHVDRSGKGRGDLENVAVMWTVAQISPAFKEWAEQGMREVPSVRASIPTLIDGTPLLQVLAKLGLLSTDVATINKNLKSYSEQVGAQLNELLALGGEMSRNIGVLLDKQDQLLSYLENAEAKRELRELQNVAYQAKVDGTYASVRLLSSLVGLVDERAGEALGTIGTATVSIVQSVGRYQDTLKALDKLSLLTGEAVGGTRLLSTIRLTADIYTTVFSVVTTLLSLGEGDPVMASLNALHLELAQLRGEMHARFDQIDTKLDDIQQDSLTEFANVLNSLDNLSAQVTASHQVLLGIGSRLDSLELGIHQRDIDAHRNAVVEAVQGATSPTNQGVFTYRDFVDVEKRLYFAATDAPTHSPLVLEDTTIPTAATVESVLARYPTGATLRYLTAQVPKAFGGDPLSTATLANPTSWAYAAQGWASLVAAWPAYAAQLPNLAGRAQAIVDVGQTLNDVVSRLSAAPGGAFLDHLLDSYDELLTQLGQQSNDVVNKFSTPPEQPGYPMTLDLTKQLPTVTKSMMTTPQGKLKLCNGTGALRDIVELSYYEGTVALADVLHRWNPAAPGLGAASVCAEPVWEGEVAYTYHHYTDNAGKYGVPRERVGISGTANIGAIIHVRVDGVDQYTYHLDWAQLGLKGKSCWNPWGTAEDPKQCSMLLPVPAAALQNIPSSTMKSAIGAGHLAALLNDIKNHVPKPRIAAAAAAEVTRRRTDLEHQIRLATAQQPMADTLAQLSGLAAVFTRFGQFTFSQTMAASDVLTSVFIGSNSLLTDSGSHAFSAEVTAQPLPPGQLPWHSTLQAARNRSAAVRSVIDDYYAAAAAGRWAESLPVVDSTNLRIALALGSVSAGVQQPRSDSLDTMRQQLSSGDAAGALASLQAMPAGADGQLAGALGAEETAILAGAAQDAADALQQQLATDWAAATETERRSRMRNAVGAAILARVLGSNDESGATEWYDDH